MKGEQQQIKKAAEQIGTGLKEEKTRYVKDTLRRVTQEGKSPKEAMGLTDAMVEGIYGQAYRLYNTGKYHEASQLFRMLIMLNATEPKYIMGLAACFHLMKEFKNAVDAYSVLGIIDTQSPISFYHASDCFIQMGDTLSAIVSLEMAIKRAGDKPEFKTLKDRASLTVENLKNEMTKKK